MAIRTKSQTGNFGFPLDFSSEFHDSQFYIQQPNEQILLQQKNPEKFNGAFLQNQQQWSRAPRMDYNGVLSISEIQTAQMDQYLKLQSEKLRFMIQKKANEQMRSLLTKIETNTWILIKEKDEEIARAKKRGIELEEILIKLEIENQEQQRVVQENAARVISLNNMLEQMRERIYSVNDDAESMNRKDDAIDNPTKKTMICRACNSNKCSVLFLPCRHLCTCKHCEPLLDSCPICNSTKKATIEPVIF